MRNLCIQSLDINQNCSNNGVVVVLVLVVVVVLLLLLLLFLSLDINENCSDNDGDKETGCDQLAKARADSHNLRFGKEYYLFLICISTICIKYSYYSRVIYLFPIFDLVGSKSVYIFCNARLLLPTLNHPTVQNILSGERQNQPSSLTGWICFGAKCWI